MTPRWSLIRAAIVSIDGEAPMERRHLTVGSARAAIGPSIRYEGRLTGSMCVSAVPLVAEPDLAGNTLDIPSAERLEAETAIEVLARLLAVDGRAPHSILSPMPYVGIACEDTDQMQRLQGATVNLDAIRTVRAGVASANLWAPEIAQSLSDRIDGLGLLASALNNSGPLGEFMQLIRVFERAFKLPPSRLADPLAEFLASGQHSVQQSEVETWMVARNPAAHADREDKFLLDADVRPLLPRMLEAAYDVLMNKEQWRSSSTARRPIWRAAAGTMGDSGIFLTKGRDAQLVFHLLDAFLAYPILTAGPVDALLPRAAWFSAFATSGDVQIMGQWDHASLLSN